MQIEETSIEGALVISFDQHADARGSFERLYCANELINIGIKKKIAQINFAHTASKSTIRGLHYQVSPYKEIKIVRCISGAIYDVIVDLRHEMSSYGSWFGITLSRENRNILVVPEGCAHGYQALTNCTDVIYPTTGFYSPSHEKGIRWNDPFFNISWPLSNPIVSEKDFSFPDFSI